MHRTIAAVTLAVVGLLGLSACTGTPSPPESPGAPLDAQGDDGQSVADACGMIQQTIADATERFEGAASADPASVVDAMTSAAAKLTDAAAEVTNDQVAALLPSLRDMFAQTADAMQAIVDGDLTKVGDLAALGQSFQDTSQAFQELCG